MLTRGVIYVAYGKPAIDAMRVSADGLPSGMQVAVVSDVNTGVGQHIYAPDADRGARWAKLSIDDLSPFEHTCYLDADTLPLADISAGFEMLADGWELVIAPSQKQGQKVLWHLDEDERAITFDELGYEPLQLQGGVFFFAKCERVHQFFAVWREEWQRYRGKDQGALLRALQRVPLRVWLLGRPWNGGAVIAHYFGRAART